MSSEAVVKAIQTVSQEFLFYSSFFLVIIGLIGNILNIITFTCLKHFQGNQCVFYFIVEAIADCSLLLIISPTFIDAAAWQYDLAMISLFWCKMRPVLFSIFRMTSLTTICFVTFDQYLSTSHRYYIRQMSTLKLSHRLTSINVFVWVLHSITFAIFYEIRHKDGCNIFDKIYLIYFSYIYICALNGFLPLIISSMFSALAYWNVRRIIRRQMPIVRRRLDRQLTAMVLTRVIFLVLVSLPYGIQLVYTYNSPGHPDDSIRTAIEQLILNITSILYYFNFAGSFYVFLLSSTRFRRQIHYLIVKQFWQKFCCRRRIQGGVQRNQVTPIVYISAAN